MKKTQENQSGPDRLKRRSDFLRVQGEARKWVSQSLILQAAKGQEGRIAFGLTVSKKASPSAVVRNRIRRRLRALALKILPARAHEGMDYVLIGRIETATRAYADLEKDLLWCLKRLELLKAEE